MLPDPSIKFYAAKIAQKFFNLLACSVVRDGVQFQGICISNDLGRRRHSNVKAGLAKAVVKLPIISWP